jgi:anthranilate synthase/aminodeoxychorismate synthase-like glutamine amidotransferase
MPGEAAERRGIARLATGVSSVIFVIDNYDSFVYNLVQYLGALGARACVRRNDETSLAEIEALEPEGILISPGPCSPLEAGISVDVIRYLAGRIPILGVCLGHQAIGHAFGGVIRRAISPMHGKLSAIEHDGRGVFKGLDNPLNVVRYHSLVIDQQSLPNDLTVTAVAPDGEIMGVRHRTWLVEGVQFHPESIFTDGGQRLLHNFLTMARQSGDSAGRPHSAELVA